MDNVNIDDLSFSIVNKDGLEVICDVIETYYDEENDRLFAAFTDYTLNADDKMEIDVRELVKTNDSYELKEIEDAELKQELLADAFANVI